MPRATPVEPKRAPPASAEAHALLCPDPSGEILQVLGRLRAFSRPRTRLGGRDPGYEQCVGEALETLRRRAGPEFEALIALYREIPRPGNEGDARVRAALLWVLPEAKRRELDAEIAPRLFGALKDPNHPDRSDLHFLEIAARRAVDPSVYRALAEALPNLPTTEARKEGLFALAEKPLPEFLDPFGKLWVCDGKALAAPMAYALARLEDNGFPLLRRMLSESDSPAPLLALGHIGSPPALDLLLEMAKSGEDLPRRMRALQVLQDVCDTRDLAGWYVGFSANGTLGNQVECQMLNAQRDTFSPQLPGAVAEEAEAHRVADLIERMAHPLEDPAFLIQLAHALGEIRRLASCTTLQTLEAHPDPKVREAAAQARMSILKDPR